MATAAEDRPAASADLEADAEAAESQPLLMQDHERGMATAKSSRTRTLMSKLDAFLATNRKLWRRPVVDTMTYKVDVLSGWSVFVLRGVKTAFNSSSAWLMLLQLLCLSIVVAVLVVALVPDPAQAKSSKFQSISVFLRILVGLLLGFFMSSSVRRWYECAYGFLEVFDAIRNLQLQLLALGVSTDLKFKCVRYCVISNHLLAKGFEIEAMQEEARSAATELMWDQLVDAHGDCDEEPTAQDEAVTQRFLSLTRTEADILRTCQDPAGMVWIWVASLVARMAQDGWIPAMASPTYGRIMNLVQAANDSIRTIKMVILVQAPFMYVHMLACLVHVNNIVNAISFGIVLGSTIGTGLQLSGKNVAYSHQAKESDLLADVENVFISFVISMFGPFLYQVLLEVSLHIANPFSSVESQIPTGRLLDGLQRDLSDAIRMGAAPLSCKDSVVEALSSPRF